jgi:hypothetical protein
MSSLNKSQILAIQDVEVEKVDIPEWGEGAYVYVRQMSAGSRDKFETAALRSRLNDDPSKADTKGLRSLMAMLCMCDEHGVLLFDYRKDAPELEKKNANALDRIVTAAQKFNGMHSDSIKEAQKN